MSNVRNIKQPGSQSEWFPLYLLAVAAILWFIAASGIRWAWVLGGPRQEVSWNPLVVLRDAMEGRLEIGPPAMVMMVVVTVLVTIPVAAVLLFMRRRKESTVGGDVKHATRYMASKRDIRSMSRRSVAAAAERMKLDLRPDDEPGILIGKELGTGNAVYADYETLLTQLWAARRGKTTSQVLPQILSAPGGVITSSNKRDTVDDSVKARSAVGEVWVFDPQRIYTEETPDWFFDPLDYIRRRPRDEWDAAATGLASLFRDDAGMTEGEKDMFSEGGQKLIAGMLLAATCDELPITKVIEWANDERDKQPIEILMRHGWNRKARALDGQYELVDRTRSGVFGNAAQMVAALEHEVPSMWVSPAAGKRRFDADAFIHDSQSGRRPTMYLLSKEGPTSASALTLALLVTLMDAAEEYGQRNPGGRLRVPLVCPLDEAANTVRWGQLANKYSHYGSRSIIITTILQSFSQARRIWGEDSTRDMLTNGCLVYGGGIKDEKFLGELAAFIGDHEEKRVSRSSDGSMRASVSEQVSEKQTLSVAELQSLPFGVALVIPQKSAPMLVRTVPWWERTFPKSIDALVKEKN